MKRFKEFCSDLHLKINLGLPSVKPTALKTTVLQVFKVSFSEQIGKDALIYNVLLLIYAVSTRHGIPRSNAPVKVFLKEHVLSSWKLQQRRWFDVRFP